MGLVPLRVSLHYFHLFSDLLWALVETAVSPWLPIKCTDVILGYDLAGVRVWTDGPPLLYVAVTTLRGVYLRIRCTSYGESLFVGLSTKWTQYVPRSHFLDGGLLLRKWTWVVNGMQEGNVVQVVVKHQAQGALQCFHQTFKSTLHSCYTKFSQDWAEFLCWLLLTILEVSPESPDFSPNEVLFGHNLGSTQHVGWRVEKCCTTLKLFLHITCATALKNDNCTQG